MSKINVSTNTINKTTSSINLQENNEVFDNLKISNIFFNHSTIGQYPIDGYNGFTSIESDSSDAGGNSAYIASFLGAGDIILSLSSGSDAWNGAAFKSISVNLDSISKVTLDFKKKIFSGHSLSSVIFMFAVPSTYFNSQMTTNNVGFPYALDINPFNQQAQDIITAFNNGGYPRTFSSSVLGSLNLDVLSLSGYWNIVVGLGSNYSEGYQSFEAAFIPLNFELE